jgi:alcohol/geraniol dehydrogenase (NADP+)
MIHAYAAHQPGGELQPFDYEPSELGSEEVEINVEFCGVCHSDLSMLDNEGQMVQYPLVPGHEVVGTIAAVGEHVKRLSIGQKVGLGWYSSSCMTCEWCMSGDHNLCLTAEGTILGRYGGFADRVRAHEAWAIPLPETLDPVSAGPLFCGGITVYNPLVQFDVKPSDRVGVIGVGGLGHLALQFLHAWGCDVTVFSSSPDKEEEARKLGADHFVNSRDDAALKAVHNCFDLILYTASVDLDWSAYIACLRPKGRLHFAGIAPNPISSHSYPLIVGQKSISGSPLGSPATMGQMLDFAARHAIAPIVEVYSFDRINEAIDRLRSGKARYRIVLKH